MREILSQGKDILYLSFSSALSTTYQSAVIAADDLREEFPDGQVLVVDSRCASLGQGLLVYLCAREKGRGPLPHGTAGLRGGHERPDLPLVHRDDLNHLKRAAASAPPPPWWAPCSPSSRCCMWTTRAG